MYNFDVAERITTFTVNIKGPLCPLEAESIIFAQVKNGTNIICTTIDKNGALITKVGNPKSLIENNDTGQFGDLHGTMQEAKDIIISL